MTDIRIYQINLDRDDDGVVEANEVDDAHHTGAADDTHVFMDSVEGTLVDGDEVVKFVDGVVDDLRGDEFVTVEQGKLVMFHRRRILGGLHQPLVEILHLTLKEHVALGELLVDG